MLMARALCLFGQDLREREEHVMLEDPVLCKRCLGTDEQSELGEPLEAVGVELPLQGERRRVPSGLTCRRRNQR